jgi:DNA topoisomerase-1
VDEAMKRTFLKLQALIALAFENRSLKCLTDAEDSMSELLGNTSSDLKAATRRRGKPTAKDERGKWTAGGWTKGFYWDADTEQWLDHNEKPAPAKALKSIAALKLSKNLVGVKINPDPTLLTGATGHFWNRNEGTVNPKPKHIQWPKKSAGRYKTKMEGLKNFDKVKKELQKVSYKDAMDGSPQAAIALALDITAQRIGGSDNETNGEPTYGLSTLEARHVKLRGNKVYFDYIGKGGHRQKHEYLNAKLATVVRAYLVSDEGMDKKRTDRIFETTDDTVRAYIKKNGGAAVKNVPKLGPHTYRYWHATSEAGKVIRDQGTPTSKRDANRIKKLACEAAAKFLGNKPGVCYETYINPVVWKDWGEDVKPAAPKKDTKGFVMLGAKAAYSAGSMEQWMEEDMDSYEWPEGFEGEPMDDPLPEVEDEFATSAAYLKAIGEGSKGKTRGKPTGRDSVRAN